VEEVGSEEEEAREVTSPEPSASAAGTAGSKSSGLFAGRSAIQQAHDNFA
jgi:hypothetical protein